MSRTAATAAVLSLTALLAGLLAAAPSARAGAPYSCTTSSDTGVCGPYSAPQVYDSAGNSSAVVNNKVWNPIPGASETMSANGLQDWQATADIPAGNTAVVAWPDSVVNLGSNDVVDPLADFTSLTSSLTIVPQETASGTREDLGWDVWGGQDGNSGSDYGYEMMIWTNEINVGDCGGDPVLTRATFGSQTFTLCENGSGPTGEFIWYMSNSSGNPVLETTSSVDIYAMLQRMISKGYYPPDYGLDAVTVGSEVASTGGQPETITLSKWTLTANAARAQA